MAQKRGKTGQKANTPDPSAVDPGQLNAAVAGETPVAVDLNDRLARYVLSPEIFGPTARSRSRVKVIIEVNLSPVEHADDAKLAVAGLLKQAGVADRHVQPLDRSYQYVFAQLTRTEANKVLALDKAQAKDQPRLRYIHRIWPDEPLVAFINRSVRTIKADACRTVFGAEGDGIVWAVIDSGIQAGHPHFKAHKTLTLPEGLKHRNFLTNGRDRYALSDKYGHGTHVAGVLAGETCPTECKRKIYQFHKERGDGTTTIPRVGEITTPMRGVAPKCKIMSLKVLNDKGEGDTSALISALEYVARLNGDGRHLRVHGVNLSVGYPFDAEWYAAGHSPLCATANRLSKDGVVVVVAAGNDGSAHLQTDGRLTTQRVGIDQSINDPGNAEEVITVGATHAESPHTYGVSFFSSRGPTADGRAKPDLVAPGERILSCASVRSQEFRDLLADAMHEFDPRAAYFREDSGTSMAAPHVSGAAAALMSVKTETRGNSEMVKDILLRSCTDLKRKPDFQGAGLLDLLRAFQSI